MKNRMPVADDDIYITKIGKGSTEFKHINIIGLKPHHCPICNKQRKLQAHHIIPRKLNCKNENINELRVMICKKCHEKLHPENKYIAFLRTLIPFLEENNINIKHLWDGLRELAYKSNNMENEK